MFSPREVKAVLFDLDGTLIDSSEDIAFSVQESLRICGHEVPSRAEIMPYMGSPLGETMKDLDPGLTDEDVESVFSAFRQHYPRHWLEHTAPYEGVMDTLPELAKTFTLAVVTTKRQVQADGLTAELGMEDFFAHIQGWSEGLRHKPDPDLILKTVEALNVSPGDAVMVGDTFRDVLAGKNAGCRTIAVTYGVGTEAELSELNPDGLARSFAEVADLLDGRA
ncbi:MAG: HAD family hydrolase [Planctomycetota bacterium]|jgi:HAD superfamily hydrolase (TIGR01509 family)